MLEIDIAIRFPEPVPPRCCLGNHREKNKCVAESRGGSAFQIVSVSDILLGVLGNSMVFKMNKSNALETVTYAFLRKKKTGRCYIKMFIHLVNIY